MMKFLDKLTNKLIRLTYRRGRENLGSPDKCCREYGGGGGGEGPFPSYFPRFHLPLITKF